MCVYYIPNPGFAPIASGRTYTRSYIPSLYDQIIDSELGSFPRTWRMRWLPLTRLIDSDNLAILKKLSNSGQFVNSRDDHYQFGLERFMKLEELMDNFPPLHGDQYTVGDASFFAWGTSMDYLNRHFPHFLKSQQNYIKKHEIKSLDSLLSLRIRSLFVFYKYYLHGQSPGPSDFMDFAHVSYAPYCDVFVTERNVSNVLNHIKSTRNILKETKILHLNDLLRDITHFSQ